MRAFTWHYSISPGMTLRGVNKMCSCNSLPMICNQALSIYSTCEIGRLMVRAVGCTVKGLGFKTSRHLGKLFYHDFYSVPTASIGLLCFQVPNTCTQLIASIFANFTCVLIACLPACLRCCCLSLSVCALIDKGSADGYMVAGDRDAVLHTAGERCALHASLRPTLMC